MTLLLIGGVIRNDAVTTASTYPLTAGVYYRFLKLNMATPPAPPLPFLDMGNAGTANVWNNVVHRLQPDHQPNCLRCATSAGATANLTSTTNLVLIGTAAQSAT